MKKSWIEYAKSLLILLITVIICSFLALNLIFVGYVPAEVIFPTNPCMPPYMSRIPPECEESIDFRFENDQVQKANQKSLFKRCLPSAFRKRWDEGLSPELVKLLDDVQFASKKRQSFEYTTITARNRKWDASGIWNRIQYFFEVEAPIVMGKTFLNMRKQHHILHSLFKNMDSRISFLILLVVFIILITTNVFFPTLAGFFTIWQILALLNFIYIVVTQHTYMITMLCIPLLILLPIVPLWVTLFFAKDCYLNYFGLFLLNSKVRTICACKLSEYWPIVSLVFVFFALQKAAVYLDATTVTCMWIVYVIFIIINRKKILGESSGGKSTSATCEGTKIFTQK